MVSTPPSGVKRRGQRRRKGLAGRNGCHDGEGPLPERSRPDALPHLRDLPGHGHHGAGRPHRRAARLGQRPLGLVRVEHPPAHQPRGVAPVPPLPAVEELGGRPLPRSQAPLARAVLPCGHQDAAPRREAVVGDGRDPGQAGRGAGVGAGHPAPGDGGLGAGEDHQPGRALLLRPDFALVSGHASRRSEEARSAAYHPGGELPTERGGEWSRTCTMCIG